MLFNLIILCKNFQQNFLGEKNVLENEHVHEKYLKLIFILVKELTCIKRKRKINHQQSCERHPGEW